MNASFGMVPASVAAALAFSASACQPGGTGTITPENTAASAAASTNARAHEDTSARMPPSSAPASARYGALMAAAGRRFELLGRAALSRRWELAAFELHEVEEAFGEL